MHEHDLDLIAALADGSLEDETEARALVASCEVCRAEYTAQTEVIAWLASAPPVTLTDVEKASLHRDLWTELRSEPVKQTGTPWWRTLSYVAAGLFVVVGLAGVLGNDAIDFGGETAATIAAADSTGGDGAPAEEAPFLASGEIEDELQESAPDTTLAATAEGGLAVPFAELAEETRAAQAERVQTQSLDADREECLARAGLHEHVVVDEIELDRAYLLVMPEDPDAEPIVTFVVLPGCEIVYVG
jgi:hypothetical protein